MANWERVHVYTGECPVTGVPRNLVDKKKKNGEIKKTSRRDLSRPRTPSWSEIKNTS